MIKFHVKNYEDLYLDELHDIFALRSEIFVVEQNCLYQDIDGKDKDALHVLGKNKNEIVAYARIFVRGESYSDFTSIGRVLVKKKSRGKSLGHQLMAFCIKFLETNNPKCSIKISAQTHLEKFYYMHGFRKQGESYLEDGIPHIEMLKEVF
jgi:ElaA protein